MKARVAAFFILLVVFLFPIQSTFADHEGTHEATSAAKKSIEYAMPYPGLLPDSPFYFLKMIRDRVVEVLVSDPLKQAEFDLLQADKRVQAGIYLLNKDTKKANLSLATISKGQQYFKKALADSENAKKQGYPIRTLSSKLHLSAQKHQELLHSISKKIPGSERGFYQKVMSESDVLIKEAGSLNAKEHSKK